MPTLSDVIAWGTTPNVSRIIIAFLIGYLVLLWISIIVWTTKDIISRTNNVVYQLISILLVVVLNIFGLLVYLGIRPAKTLIEKFFEDLEYEALAQATQSELEKPEKKPRKRAQKKSEPNKKIASTKRAPQKRGRKKSK